ncbi:hypothetical protein BGX21_003640 [Mortierella sp. AD011]|nr:hypothetical protein BGX20_003817 [Mortierella sp. AD010]KAF9400731.1 hypothetical protein BGX21_003640 [Mortierella sp. AD011]
MRIIYTTPRRATIVDRTSISDINDNPKHTRTTNQHGNKHITITKTFKETRGGGSDDSGRGSSEMSPKEFFDRRDLAPVSSEEGNANDPLTHYGLLF